MNANPFDEVIATTRRTLAGQPAKPKQRLLDLKSEWIDRLNQLRNGANKTISGDFAAFAPIEEGAETAGSVTLLISLFYGRGLNTKFGTIAFQLHDDETLRAFLIVGRNRMDFPMGTPTLPFPDEAVAKMLAELASQYLDKTTPTSRRTS